MGNEMVIVRNSANLEQWQERISECHRSGMTVAAWCEKQGISDKTYYYWHRKLTKLQELTGNAEPSAFYEINSNIRNTVEITATLHCCGVNADVYSGADEETLFAHSLPSLSVLASAEYNLSHSSCYGLSTKKGFLLLSAVHLYGR